MELRSPCGASIGQLAYYHNGKIYTCDEGRMLSEMGNDEFCLGNVFHDSYDSLMNNSRCKITCASSVLESLPKCCDCVFQPYCGSCPVVNYALSGNIFPASANGYRCKINQGILTELFRIIREDEEGYGVIRGWTS